MAATQNVVIKLTTTGNTREIQKHRRELIKLAAAGKIANYNGTSLSNTFTKMDKRLNMFKGTVMMAGKALSSMNRIALKLFTIGFAAGAASLTLVNALFVAGRIVANLYKTTMQALAAVVAAVGAALAGAAAAMREYTAAVQAYAFKSSPALNNRLFESRAALRALQDDAVLASFGIQALNQAFANIAKNTQVTAVSKNLLKGLADFASAGGDPAQNLAAAAEFVGLLQKAGRLDQKALAAAESLGPTFVDALKKARSQGVSTLGDLSRMIQSGELSRLGGVEGQAGIVSGTLLGQFKSVFMELNVMAADFGQSLLGPIKEALQDIGILVKRLVMRVGPEMIAFGRGGMLGGLVGMFEKLEDFTVKIFREYLPGANGMMGRFVELWNKVLYWYNDFVDGLRSLLPLGSAVIEAFGKPFMAIFETVGSWIRYVGESIRNNQAAYNRFGNTLLEFIRKIQNIGKQFIDTFTDALPMLDQFLGFIGSAVDMVMGLVGAFGLVFNLLGNIVNLMGGQGTGLGSFLSMIPFMFLFGPGGKGRRGRMMERRRGGGLLGGLIGGMTVTGDFGPGDSYGGGALGSAYSRFKNRRQGGQASPGGLQLPPFSMTGPTEQFVPYGTPYGPKAPLGVRAKAFGRRFGFGMMNPKGFMGTMGPAMALSLGSLFATDEAQKPLMAGGMLASLAPALGKFGPYAALAGVALGGLGAATTAQTGAGGAGMGALGGAAAGGGIGMMLGGPLGAAVGVVLGAAAGAVYGYFKGKSNADKKKAKESASEYMDKVYGDLSKDFFTGDVTGIRKTIDNLRTQVSRVGRIARLGEGESKYEREQIFGAELAAGRISQTEYDALVAAPGTYRRELEKSLKATEALLPMADRFDAVAQTASDAFGITTEKLLEMANAAGVNLFDDTVKLTDQLKALGLAVNYTAEQIKGAVRDIQVSGVERLQERVAQMNSGAMMDELVEGLYQSALTGPVGVAELGSFIQDFLGQLNLRNPNATFRNLEIMRVLFGEGGALYAPGGQLAGQEAALGALPGLITGLETDVTSQGRAGLQDMITRQLLFSGVSVNQGQLKEMLAGMSPAALDKLVMDLAAGKLGEGTFASRGAGDTRIYGRRRAGLEAVGLGGLTFQDIEIGAMTMEQKIAAFGEEGAAIITGMNKVIEAAFTSKPDWMKTPPDWYNKESFMALLDSDGDGTVGPDTRTPRGDTTSQRLGRTLSRHNYFNSMLTGKRNMTSAYRTNMLGSINSDHVMGRAYDLTGQNLGAYSTMVNRMGGFAEFHGTGGSRHLHVVPGETPVGDTTAPYMSSGVAPVSSGSTNNTYNFVVNAAPGMDVNSLANAVMDKIQRVERQNAERS